MYVRGNHTTYRDDHLCMTQGSRHGAMCVCVCVSECVCLSQATHSNFLFGSNKNSINKIITNKYNIKTLISINFRFFNFY